MDQNSGYLKNVILFGAAIIPEIEANEVLAHDFSKNFTLMVKEVDEDSQKKLQLLVSLVAFLSLIYNFKSFAALSQERRQAYIEKLFHFPIAKFVSGLTGLRSLCMIAYYNIEEVMNEINYDGPIK